MQCGDPPAPPAALAPRARVPHLLRGAEGVDTDLRPGERLRGQHARRCTTRRRHTGARRRTVEHHPSAGRDQAAHPTEQGRGCAADSRSRQPAALCASDLSRQRAEQVGAQDRRGSRRRPPQQLLPTGRRRASAHRGAPARPSAGRAHSRGRWSAPRSAPGGTGPPRSSRLPIGRGSLSSRPSMVAMQGAPAAPRHRTSDGETSKTSPRSPCSLRPHPRAGPRHPALVDSPSRQARAKRLPWRCHRGPRGVSGGVDVAHHRRGRHPAGPAAYGLMGAVVGIRPRHRHVGQSVRLPRVGGRQDPPPAVGGGAQHRQTGGRDSLGSSARTRACR